MGAQSDIEWTDSSWTPIRALNLKTGKIGWHCEHATTGCEFCYAEGMNKRLGTGLPFKPGHRKDIELFLDEGMLLAPLRWKKPRRIFVCSMTDAFAEFVTDEMLDKIFAVMALCPQHTFQVLTKRAERMPKYLRGNGIRQAIDIQRSKIDPIDGDNWMCTASWPLPNVWLGVSCERQQEADERIPLLRETPAAIRFISFEPLLGHIEPDLRGIHWAIVGGESGPDARPMHPKWPRRLRNICAEQSVAFFFKQWGQWADPQPGGDLGGDVRSGRVRIVHPNGQSDVGISLATGGHSTIPGSRYMARVGKKAAGRLLDGVEHNGFPSPAGAQSPTSETDHG